MAIKINFDDRVMRKRMAIVMANQTDARQVALREMTEVFVEQVRRTAPVDTGRWLAAMEQAARDLGLPYVVTPIKASSDWKKRYEGLQKQLRFWDFIVKRYEREGRQFYKGVKKSGPDKGYVRAKRIRDRAMKSLREFDRTSLVIGGRRQREGQRFGLSHLDSVRNKVYGGTGQWIVLDDRTIARLHNKEPHARIVEKNTKTVYRAIGKIRHGGARKVSEAYTKRVAQGTPWYTGEAA